MPPITEPNVVGWLLLFIPGFVALGVAGYFGHPTTRWQDLRWVVYSVLTSLGLEIALRWTADPFIRNSIDPINHPVRRAMLLLLYAVVAGIVLGVAQSWSSLDTREWRPVRAWRRLWLRLFARWTFAGRLAQRFHTWRVQWGKFVGKFQPRVWHVFFEHDDVLEGWVRVELTNGQAYIAHVRNFSINPGDQPRELLLNHIRLERHGEWIEIPGATMYVDGGQIRSVVRVEDPNQLLAVTQYLGSEGD